MAAPEIEAVPGKQEKRTVLNEAEILLTSVHGAERVAGIPKFHNFD